jgi:exodeoxyribonuclease V alpha subunit
MEVSPGSGGFTRNEAKPLEYGLLVVDETSMVEVVLMNRLLRALPPKASILLVGDVDQLPSGGPGKVRRVRPSRSLEVCHRLRRRLRRRT